MVLQPHQLKAVREQWLVDHDDIATLHPDSSVFPVSDFHRPKHSNEAEIIPQYLSLSGGAVGNVHTVATAFAVSDTFGSVTPNYAVTCGSTDIAAQRIPEPSTMMLVVAGLGGCLPPSSVSPASFH
jgi:hypothetical protein